MKPWTHVIRFISCTIDPRENALEYQTRTKKKKKRTKDNDKNQEWELITKDKGSKSKFSQLRNYNLRPKILRS